MYRVYTSHPIIPWLSPVFYSWQSNGRNYGLDLIITEVFFEGEALGRIVTGDSLGVLTLTQSCV